MAGVIKENTVLFYFDRGKICEFHQLPTNVPEEPKFFGEKKDDLAGQDNPAMKKYTAGSVRNSGPLLLKKSPCLFLGQFVYVFELSCPCLCPPSIIRPAVIRGINRY